MTSSPGNRNLPALRPAEPRPPAITNHYGKAFYEYWLAQRGAAIVPARAVIDPATILDLMSMVHVLNRNDDGSFLWRLVGAELVEFFGRDLSGETFDPSATPRHDRRFLAVYDAVTSQPCGAVIRCCARTRGVRTVVLETVALPMLDASGRPTKILAHSEPLGLGHRHLQHVCHLVELRIESVDLFDIGAGLPPGRITWPLSGLESRDH